MGNQTNYMDIQDIRKAWDSGEYHFDMEIPAKVSEDHVFDVDLSVRRNREMVQEWNDKVSALQKEKMSKNTELSRKLTNDVVAYLMGNYGFTEVQARKIQEYVYVNYHSFMYDYFTYIDEIGDMVYDVLNGK